MRTRSVVVAAAATGVLLTAREYTAGGMSVSFMGCFHGLLGELSPIRSSDLCTVVSNSCYCFVCTRSLPWRKGPVNMQCLSVLVPDQFSLLLLMSCVLVFRGETQPEEEQQQQQREPVEDTAAETGALRHLATASQLPIAEQLQPGYSTDSHSL
jgi:hypothetical protein